MRTKNIVFTIILGLLFLQVNAQETEKKESPVDFSVKLQSNHLWRGLIITDKPMAAVFTSIKLNKSGSLTTGFWGGMSFSNESDGTYYKEIDYYVQYASGGFSIGLWDLFNTRGKESPDIWDYKKETTGHLLDLRTSYKFGEKFPLRLEADFLLFGRGDAQFINEDLEQRTSSYVEVSYPFIENSTADVTGFLGAGFCFNGDTHLYGEGEESFDIVNVGFTISKKVKIGNSNIPVSATTMWNPSKKYARIQFAATLF